MRHKTESVDVYLPSGLTKDWILNLDPSDTKPVRFLCIKEFCQWWKLEPHLYFGRVILTTNGNHPSAYRCMFLESSKYFLNSMMRVWDGDDSYDYDLFISFIKFIARFHQSLPNGTRYYIAFEYYRKIN